MNASAKHQDEAKLDIKANGFWVKGQTTFLDIRVFNPNAKRYNKNKLKQCYLKNEVEKKRHYNKRIIEIEHGSFTPLVFTINGGMAKECCLFYSRLAEMLSQKRKIDHCIVKLWIRRKINFLHSMLLCLRVSRSIKKVNLQTDDIELMEKTSKFVFFLILFLLFTPGNFYNYFCI